VIFVDTGAWFAVAVRNDPDHTAAMTWLDGNREPLVTTDYILAETATLVRMRDKTARGHRLAVRIATSLLNQEAAILERVTGRDLEQALRIFQKYRGHLFSFVDCTSFVVMERLHISHAFAFDQNFDEYPGISRGPSQG
jgi:predicted nucleic acid-binding protein